MIPDFAHVAAWGYVLAAIAFFLFSLYVAAASRGRGPGGALLFATGASTAWCVASAALIAEVPYAGAASALLSVVRDGAWLWFVLRLVSRIDSGRRRWPVQVAVGVVLARFALVVMGLLGVSLPFDVPAGVVFSQLLTAVFFAPWCAGGVFAWSQVVFLGAAAAGLACWVASPRSGASAPTGSRSSLRAGSGSTFRPSRPTRRAAMHRPAALRSRPADLRTAWSSM